ncbi:MAG: hypothetical protein H0W81_08055 [Chloroflexi bacterium]|nr:hypothetical protein [Chloroflexota bacterium]
MTHPIVFISHFRIRPGKLDGLRPHLREGSTGLQEQKPRTVAFLAYVDQTGMRATIVHVFPDAEAMDRHFEGSEERSRDAYEFLEPDGWEIYGTPSAAALGMLSGGASAAGVSFTVQPDYIAGFLRLAQG